MKQLISTTLSSLRSAVHRRFEERQVWNTRSAQVLRAVEHAVDATDSRIRLVRGYRKKLQGVVGNALDFTDRLVGRIPGALEVSSRTFLADPYVNAFFVNATDLQEIFSHSSEVRDFMDDCLAEQTPYCYALLCMRRSEKTVLGMDLAGDVLKRDVRQVVVNFSDHRIYSPAPSESETRQGLRDCLFGGLISNALGRIMEQRLESHRLQTERHVLRLRYRQLQQATKQADRDSRDATGLQDQVQDTARRLGDIENRLMETHAATPQEALDTVIAVFSRPDRFVRMQHHWLRLNKMGIKLDRHSREPCNELHLTEVVIGGEPPRVVTLAKFPRAELLAPRDFLTMQVFS